MQQQLFALDAFLKHRTNKLSIEISLNEIKSKMASYELIQGEARLHNGTGGFNGELKIDRLVACGHWHRLSAIKGDKINLMEHLEKLIPTSGKGVGFLTFQNGIQNDLSMFKAMGKQILDNLKASPARQPLCIGLHNPTNGNIIGFSSDVNRLLDEWGLNGISILFFRQMLFTLATLLPTINPDLLWSHIAHSEAGKLAKMVLTPSCNKLSPPHQEFLKKHLLVSTFGSAAPIPDGVALDVLNFCTQFDITRLIPYDKGNCNITIIPGSDHSFLGDPYKGSLQKYIARLKGKLFGGIYYAD